MNKDVKVYKQRKDMCAIACLMMVLEYYKLIQKANWYDERRLYRIYGSKYISGTPFSALAFHLSKNGLNTILFHEKQNLFENNYNVFDNYKFELIMGEYKKYLNLAKNNGVKILNGILLNVDILKERLREGYLIILAGELMNNYHAILLTGYTQNGFYVCDPLYKTKQVRTFDEIELFMNTKIGKWFIAVNDKK